MATTVTYKGQTLATVENQTKTLQTAGTWCEDDFTLTDVSGGGDNIEKMLTSTLYSYSSDISGGLLENAFYKVQNLASISFPNITRLNGGCFYEAFQLSSVNCPKVKTIWGTNTFRGCNSLETIVLPELVTVLASGGTFFSAGIKTADLGQVHENGFDNNFFYNCPLTTLILRYTGGVCQLKSVMAFRDTPFKDGGTGGTLYVPSALISSYQSATNWSTILGYANNQILPIEGSQYENYYADGTVIS